MDCTKSIFFRPNSLNEPGKPPAFMAEELRRAKIKRREERAARRRNKICGKYKRGTEIQGDIVRCYNMNEFYFNSERVLTLEHYDKMKSAYQIKHSSGHLMYAARPYTSDIGDVKLLRESNGTMKRCKIADLYTICKKGQLQIMAHVLLIDLGYYELSVSFDDLYDAPQFINYYLDIEPEAKHCRVYLGNPVPLTFKDDEINEDFCNKVRLKIGMGCKIRIMDYKDGVYFVDLIDHRDNSMIEFLKNKYAHKLKKYERKGDESSTDEDRPQRRTLGFMDPWTFTKNSRKDYTYLPHPAVRMMPEQSRRPKTYHGILQYFQTKIREIEAEQTRDDCSGCALLSQFFTVKVLSWCDPDSFCIIPNDPIYTNNHEDFKKQLDRIQEVFEQEDAGVKQDKRFAIGECILFKNEYEPKLGRWLRGIVTRVPHISENGIVHSKAPKKRKGQYQNKENDPNKFHLDQIVYRIRSIDYGFQCFRSAMNMRHVKDKRLFRSKGPWALRCRLFGIDPLISDAVYNGKPRFSRACLNMIDCWMRERILDNSKFALFYVLLRTDIGLIRDWHWQVDKPAAEITLFHRHEPPYSAKDCVLPRKRRTRYDCLNTHLINRGLAGDYMYDKKVSSNVQLDQYILNLLVRNDKI